MGANNSNSYLWWGVCGAISEGFFIGANGDSALIVNPSDSIVQAYSPFATLTAPSLIYCDEDTMTGVAGNPWNYYLWWSGVLTISWNKKLKHWIREYNKDMLSKFKELQLYTYVYKNDEFDFNKCFENNCFNEKKARRLYRKSKTLQLGV